MNYTIYKDTLRDGVIKKISERAARARSEEGQSLYDAIYPTSRDYATIDGTIDEAIYALQVRLANIGIRSSVADEVLMINLPDIPEDIEELVAKALSDYLETYASAKWIEHALPSELQMYAGYLTTSINNLLGFLLQRKTMS